MRPRGLLAWSLGDPGAPPCGPGASWHGPWATLAAPFDIVAAPFGIFSHIIFTFHFGPRFLLIFHRLLLPFGLSFSCFSLVFVRHVFEQKCVNIWVDFSIGENPVISILLGKTYGFSTFSVFRKLFSKIIRRFRHRCYDGFCLIFHESLSCFRHRFLHRLLDTFLMDNGSRNCPVCRPLAPFWHPLGSVQLPFGSLWHPFGTLWLHLARSWHTLGSTEPPFGSTYSFWYPFGYIFVGFSPPRGAMRLPNGVSARSVPFLSGVLHVRRRYLASLVRVLILHCFFNNNSYKKRGRNQHIHCKNPMFSESATCAETICFTEWNGCRRFFFDREINENIEKHLRKINLCFRIARGSARTERARSARGVLVYIYIYIPIIKNITCTY